MRLWTEARFEAAASYDPVSGRKVVWLDTGRRRSSRRFAETVTRIGRGTLIVGLGCAAVGAAPNAALAPVSTALASVEISQVAPPIPLALDIEARPIFGSASVEAPEAIRDEQPRDPEEVLRFGSRELPRHLVATIVRAASAAEVDPTYLMALADKESSFRADVRASTSSAEGLFQFIDRTWLESVRDFGGRHGLEADAAHIATVDDRPVVEGEAVRARILDRRRDPYLSAVMAAEMSKRDAALIGFRIGRRLTNTEMYLAHFLGFEDAARFIGLRGAKHPQSATRSFPAAARANAAIFFERGRRGRRGLSVPEVYARIDRLIDARVARFEGVRTYASAE